jgi:hypothetical protein
MYRDLKEVTDTDFDGGKFETAKSLKLSGIAIEVISKSIGLSKEETKKIYE